jgi:hypothetical protein
VITACKADASCSAGDAALKVVAALKQQPAAAATPNAGAAYLQALAADDAATPKPSGAAGQPEANGEQALVQSIIALHTTTTTRRAAAGST